MNTATTSEVLVVHHDHVSPGGPVADRFARRGWTVVDHLVVPADRFHDPGVTTEFPDFAGFDAVVVLGSYWSAYDHELLGPRFIATFLAYKRNELERFGQWVTDWEFREYSYHL